MIFPVVLAALVLSLGGGRDPDWHVMQCGNDLMQHPKACIIFDNASETFGLEINLVRLRWKGWEDDVVTGSGREGSQKVSVRLWRPKRDCDGLGYAYTRIRVRSTRGEVTAKLSTCPDLDPQGSSNDEWVPSDP